MTPHIQAKKGTIAPLVLMPGDPLRAKYIADNFLENVQLVSSVRNVLMYTGTYNNKLISICASGMGQPSIGIYSYELFKFYDVQKIIRIGSAGAYLKELELYDLVLATSSYTDSTHYGFNLFKKPQQIFYPSSSLTEEIIKLATKHQFVLHQGQVHCSDVFYSELDLQTRINQSQAICVEMESAMLFATAKYFNRQAACLLTISDNLITGKQTSSQERETSFKSMVYLALQLVC